MVDFMTDYSRISKWLIPASPREDVVISSRVRVARNLEELPFPARLDPQGLRRVLDRVREVVETASFQEKAGVMTFLAMEELDRRQINLLFEKHLISPRHLALSTGRAVVLDPEESVSILVNEEDHLRIQGFLPGLNVNGALTMLMELDDALEEHLSWSFDEQWGHLTSCPTNVGTGLRASVMLHLPALTGTGKVEELARDLQGRGFVLRGYYGEGTRAHGDIYQVSNQRTLGLTEEEIAAGLEREVRMMVDRERNARSTLSGEERLDVEDRIMRSLGTLQYGMFIPAEEALRILSHLRLGALLGMDLPYRPDLAVFNALTVRIQPGHLTHDAGQRMNARERDRYRADMLRRSLAQSAGRPEEKEEQDNG